MIESMTDIQKPKWGLRLRKLGKWPSRFALVVCIVWVFTAVFADQLANELPLSCKIEGQRHFPAFEESLAKISGKRSPRIYYIGKRNAMESVVMPPVPYSPQTIDRANAGYKSPFAEQNVEQTRFRHWLGTDSLGRDVLSGLIHGSRVALVIGLLSVLIAMIAGVFLGAIAGFFGDRNLRLNTIEGLGLAFLLMALGYSTYVMLDSGAAFSYAVIAILLAIAIGVGWSKLFSKRVPEMMKGSKLSGTIGFPLDLLVLRLIEVFRALPSLFILLAIIAIIESPGIIEMSLIISMLMWPTFARYTRAEFLSLREREFVQAAKLLRRRNSYIVFREILPNATPPIAVAAAFGVSSAILAESTLSFLGIGFSADQVSWGSMLNEARLYFKAWWMAVFPGVAIFAVILAMNSLGDHISRRQSGNPQ